MILGRFTSIEFVSLLGSCMALILFLIAVTKTAKFDGSNLVLPATSILFFGFSGLIAEDSILAVISLFIGIICLIGSAIE